MKDCNKLKANLTQKSISEYHESGITTDVEKLSKTIKKSKRAKVERKLSMVSKELTKSESKLNKSESSKVKLRKHITKTSIDLIKGKVQGDYSNERNPSRNQPRNVTPFSSKKNTSKSKSNRKNISNVTERLRKNSSKSRKDLLKEEIKDSLQSINEAYLSKIEGREVNPLITSATNLKCSECGEVGFKDSRDLTGHHHKHCKAYQKCNKCDKLLKNSEYDTHVSKKCKKKLTIKANNK